MGYFNHCHLCNTDFNNYKGLASHLKQKHKDISTKEYYDRFYKSPNEGICPVCGKETTFIGRLNRGYNKHCSSQCHNADKNIIRIKKQTTKKHYGFENFRNPDKAKKTKLDRYGDENYNNSIQIIQTKQNKTAEEWEIINKKSWETRINNTGKWLSDESLNCIKQTKLLNYNDKNFNNREKTKQTCINKYGVENVMQLKEINNLAVNNRFSKYNSYYSDDGLKHIKDMAKDKMLDKYSSINDATLIDYDINNKEFTFNCNKCNNQFNISLYLAFLRGFRYKTPLCTSCNPLQDKSSNTEKNLADYITKIYPGKIIKNDRTVLNNKELDIYLPEKKLAFEFDGLYWHNEINKPNNYHVNKTNECEQHSIQLIHIFEDEWTYKQEIVKSRIKGLLGLNNRIYARKCIIKEVNYKASEEFLNKCHIQGNCVSKYRYGLYYNDELVSLMTFGKSRFANEFELLRFCNKLDTNVIGAASKLFKHFLQDHPEIKKIISFADRRWSVGNMYEKIGFTNKEVTKPAYFYIVNDIRENRIKYQKHKLIAQGYDPNKTEHEIMLERKLFRIYDCGNLKYTYEQIVEN